MFVLLQANLSGLAEHLDTIFTIVSLIFLAGLQVGYQKFTNRSQENAMNEICEQIKGLEQKHDNHITNSAIHRDPVRDEKRWEEFRQEMRDSRTETTRRLDRIESKIDQIQK